MRRRPAVESVGMGACRDELSDRTLVRRDDGIELRAGCLSSFVSDERAARRQPVASADDCDSLGDSSSSWVPFRLIGATFNYSSVAGNRMESDVEPALISDVVSRCGKQRPRVWSSRVPGVSRRWIYWCNYPSITCCYTADGETQTGAKIHALYPYRYSHRHECLS